jgi:sulfite reductase alpha subunit-like flavoprotein
MRADVNNEARQFSAGDTILLVYASQTGRAEKLARDIWEINDRRCDLRAMPELSPKDLERYGRHIYIVSTFGDGEPPQDSREFFDAFIHEAADLHEVEFSVLALGNRSYQTFCGFGNSLFRELIDAGAAACIPLVEVHNQDPAVIAHWRAKLNETFNLAAETERDWVTATVMDLVPRDNGEIELALYVQSLEHEEAKSLAVGRQESRDPLVTDIVSDPLSPFTSILIPDIEQQTRHRGLIRQLQKASPGDKWLVKVL